MYKVVEGMVSLAKSLGVQFEVNQNVEKILVDDKKKR
jgi:phytoene desaturase